MEYPGALWHVMNRGVERRDIFLDDADRNLFLNLLGDAVIAYRWRVYAYALMKNHFHLLVETVSPTLSRGMQTFTGEYADRFNKRYERVGHLFQGRFRGFIVDRESYLLEVARYIVLNPVRANVVSSAADYPWSSYRATAGLSAPPPWLEISRLLEQFHPHDRGAACDLYRVFVAEGVGKASNLWESLVASAVLGSEEFLAEVHRRRETSEPAQRIIALDDVQHCIEQEFRATIAERGWRNHYARIAFAFLSRRTTVAPWTAIASRLNTGPSAARKMSRSALKLMHAMPRFGEKVASVEILIKVRA